MKSRGVLPKLLKRFRCGSQILTINPLLIVHRKRKNQNGKMHGVQKEKREKKLSCLKETNFPVLWAGLMGFEVVESLW
jgi:hypothetical protein